MSSQVWFTVLVLAVALERLAEVVRSRRNSAWSLRHGGVETGQRHYPVMVALHTAFLLGALAEVWVRRPEFVPVLGWSMFALVLGAQALRFWCMAALGPRWNTRVIVVPGMPPVRGGPYRFVTHPNYVAVVVEGFALPLVHSAWITALLFSVANLALLRVRLRVENKALATLPVPERAAP
jgi:methyltransferase